MELNTFVTQTITQIAEGVSQVQEKIDKFSAIVNPPGIIDLNGIVIISDRSGYRTAQNIEFDVSLTETESTQAGGQVGVFFGSVGIGGHGKTEVGSNAVNRVKFSVPIALPSFNIKRNQ